MAKIQQSVEIRVPAHVAYNQLTQFADYPRFMEEVESAEQVDDSHVRWTTKIGEHGRDWHSEIVEQTPDRSIEWRNVEGPVSTGRVEVEALGDDSSRVRFTVESQAASAGDAADALNRQLGENLQRLKQMLEGGGATGAWRGAVHDGKVETAGSNAAVAAPQAGKVPGQSSAGYGDAAATEAMQEELKLDESDSGGDKGLEQAIRRAVPPAI